MRVPIIALSFLLAGDAGAQSLASRVASAEGVVQLRFPSQPGVCGDGIGSIGNLLGRHGWFFLEDVVPKHSCRAGPVRIVATVVSGRVDDLQAYVGPEPTAQKNVRDLGTVSAPDAIAWLTHFIADTDGPPVAARVGAP